MNKKEKLDKKIEQLEIIKKELSKIKRQRKIEKYKKSKQCLEYQVIIFKYQIKLIKERAKCKIVLFFYFTNSLIFDIINYVKNLFEM